MAIGPATPVEVEVEVEVDLEVEVEVEVDLEVDLEVEVEVDLEVEVEVDLEVEAVSFWLGQVLLARMSDEFAHEALDCYKLAVKLSRWAACQVFPPHRKHLRDQLVRSADSIVLNLAEGAGKGAGDSRRTHHRIALGSAAEVAAIIDITDFPDAEQRRGEVRRVGAMLAAMSRR